MTTRSAMVSTDDMRTRFSQAMSAMYQQEVPLYGELLSLVAEVNREVLAANPQLAAELADAGELERLSLERHGAIRVGTPRELATLARVFAVMGMAPVGYYDLSQAGVPVHSTAFRPVDEAALARNPFRVFTSLLRLELIEDDGLRERAAQILAEREIFTPRALELLEQHEAQGGFDDGEADDFIGEIVTTFRWHADATVPHATYRALHAEHRLIADVVCFRGPHINHLTPRTLDIDEVQRRMPQRGITPKAIIEGPPARNCPLLLRQTSFRALEENIRFADDAAGTHTARFGEIEQRGVALTAEGRARYDDCLRAARQHDSGDNDAWQAMLARAFDAFPDDETRLRREGLARFRYLFAPHATPEQRRATTPETLEAMIETGVVRPMPITYEDFLPVSAAGIFRSNLSESREQLHQGDPQRDAFEAALGMQVHDELALYGELEQASLERLFAAS
ncbi:2-oxoadipate dioxygenase/decarboxylase HglS [Kushneria aurantia]|uniref:2-oxoadipate dioxygenase/decarboxylase n=1 Tax=Kushneria aurantia TaxID=504092 RepID=A0ABV6G330_9GAMM|nr:VOC family protein [Kushneria aurantia]